MPREKATADCKQWGVGGYVETTANLKTYSNGGTRGIGLNGSRNTCNSYVIELKQELGNRECHSGITKRVVNDEKYRKHIAVIAADFEAKKQNRAPAGRTGTARGARSQ